MTLTEEFLATLAALRTGAAGPLAPVLRRTRRHVADSCAIALGATRDAAFVDALVAGIGPAGRVGSPLLGRADRLAPTAAAFTNAALAHTLDFDDIHDLARLHPTTVCFPAAWAALGVASAGLDAAAAQRRLLEAVALGNEALCRLGLAAQPTGDGPVSGWFTTQLFGAFGAAIAAAHALGLDAAATRDALGLAYMQTAGGKEPAFGTGSTARRIYPAFAAMAGVQAALLARAGLSGPADPLGGAAGVFHIYLQQDVAAQRELLLSRNRWHASDVSFKPWPCCRLSHPYVVAALPLRQALQGRVPQRLVLRVNESARRLCEPLPARIRPATLSDATYSIPFVTAFTLVHGEPTLPTLDERALGDEAVLALAARMTIEGDMPDKPGHPVGRVEAQLDDGSLLEAATAAPAELDDVALRRKFDDCLAAAGRRDADELWVGLVATPGGVLAALDAAAAAP